MPHTVTLTRERETKHTIRYQEVASADGVSVVKTLYVQKWAARQLGEPHKITLTIVRAPHEASELRRPVS